MKQRIFMLLAFVMAAMTGMTFVSCGDDNDADMEEGNQDGNEVTESFAVTYEELEGTWVYSAEDYGNIDYISFSSTGTGQMANASDYFRNVGSHENTKNGTFELVCFTYTIERNVIYVKPESISGLSSFKIEVINPISSILKLRMDLDIVRKQRAYKKYDNDWQWFTKSGPASVDLTKDLVGTYAVDNNKSHKLEVKRINNYTMTVYDLWLNTEHTGCLYWYEQYNDTFNEIHLNDANSSTTSNSYYFIDGKLYSMAGTHYFSGAASKISNENSDTSDDKSDIERLCHTWKAETKYDGTFELEFKSSGLLKEKYTDDGEVYYNNSEYSLSGSQLTLYSGIIFTNCYGYNWNGKDGYIFDLSFSSDSKSMTLKAGSASVNFTRID